MSRIRYIRRDQEGQALTELALVLPVLMLILVGIVQFGIIFKEYLTLTDAVREGARKAAVARHEPTPGDYVKQEVVKSASDLKGFTVANVKVVSDWGPGDDVTVTASYPYSIDVIGWVIRKGDMTSTTTERVE